MGLFGTRNPARGAKTVDLSGPRFNFRIVGESFYQDTLRASTTPNARDGLSGEVDVVLVPEKNKHDPNAVAVWTQGGKIGHLSRDDAAVHRPALLRLYEGQRAYAACRATLNNAGPRTNIGAVLNLDLKKLHAK